MNLDRVALDLGIEIVELSVVRDFETDGGLI